MSIMEYLCVESCRICNRMVVPKISEAKTLCNDCWWPLICQDVNLDVCRVPDFGEIRVAHAVIYEKTIKTLSYKLKYDDDRLIAKDLGKLLLKPYLQLRSENCPPANQKLVPIPLSIWRKLKRGFNQAELLAVELARIAKTKVSTGVLRRRKNTTAQHDLNREERKINMKDAFAIRSQNQVKSNSLILIDDIHTSGSTLAEAARTLFEAGAKSVSAITVSRALLNEERQTTLGEACIAIPDRLN